MTVCGTNTEMIVKISYNNVLLHVFFILEQKYQIISSSWYYLTKFYLMYVFLPGHQSFSCSWRTKQKDTLYMLHSWNEYFISSIKISFKINKKKQVESKLCPFLVLSIDSVSFKTQPKDQQTKIHFYSYSSSCNFNVMHIIIINNKNDSLPNCSITSGGNTREAKALLKIAENSLSKPPIPILLKSQSGLMMDVKACLLQTMQSNFICSN